MAGNLQKRSKFKRPVVGGSRSRATTVKITATRTIYLKRQRNKNSLFSFLLSLYLTLFCSFVCRYIWGVYVCMYAILLLQFCIERLNYGYNAKLKQPLLAVCYIARSACRYASAYLFKYA